MCRCKKLSVCFKCVFASRIDFSLNLVPLYTNVSKNAVSGGGSCVFYQPHFQMLRPTPPPLPLYFLTSPLAMFISSKKVKKIKR